MLNDDETMAPPIFILILTLARCECLRGKEHVVPRSDISDSFWARLTQQCHRGVNFPNTETTVETEGEVRTPLSSYLQVPSQNRRVPRSHCFTRRRIWIFVASLVHHSLSVTTEAVVEYLNASCLIDRRTWEIYPRIKKDNFWCFPFWGRSQQ